MESETDSAAIRILIDHNIEGWGTLQSAEQKVLKIVYTVKSVRSDYWKLCCIRKIILELPVYSYHNNIIEIRLIIKLLEIQQKTDIYFGEHRTKIVKLFTKM